LLPEILGIKGEEHVNRACCGPQAIVLPHVVERRCLSFGSTWKTKDKTCERSALSALYLRPQTAELYGAVGNKGTCW